MAAVQASSQLAVMAVKALPGRPQEVGHPHAVLGEEITVESRLLVSRCRIKRTEA
jgi:hypothetical protein